MVFKGRERPILIHRGLWQNVEVYEERELVREHDAVTWVKERLVERRKKRGHYDVATVKLAYFAHEFRGGPDILAPFYFIEVESEDKHAEKVGVTEGPKQVLWLPAYR